MRHDTNGKFKLSLRGFPLLMVARINLESEGGEATPGATAKGYGLIILGLLVGVIIPR